MDGLPILNLKNGWFAYFVSLVLTAFILFSLFHLPFIIKARKKTGENQ
jgi:hypothetical protein